MTDKHTPIRGLPWEAWSDEGVDYVSTAFDETVATVHDPEYAENIVRAVNSHALMLEALREAREVLIGLRVIFMHEPSEDEVRELVKRLDAVGPRTDAAIAAATGEDA